jgi:hypothetical protein
VLNDSMPQAARTDTCIARKAIRATHYFLTIEGKAVRDYRSFLDFLRIDLSHTSIQFGIRAHNIGEPVEVGSWGFLHAALQVLGFAGGGLAVFGYLNELPYCDNCLKYLSAVESGKRYATDWDRLTQWVRDLHRAACYDCG